MVSASTKRRRRQKDNLTATAVEESIRQAEVETRTLGTTVTKGSKDVELFAIDRSRTTKEELREKYITDGKLQRIEAKKLRRAMVKPRRSEMLSNGNSDNKMEGISYSESVAKRKKNANDKGSKVEKTLLKRIKVKSSNTNNVNNPRVSNIPGKEDLSLLNEVVGENDAVNDDDKLVNTTEDILRKKLIKKLAKKQRKSATESNAVLLPGHGLSINPTFQHHQDKLGEALSQVIKKKDEAKWTEEKLKFDPNYKIDHKTIDSATGMHVDSIPLKDQSLEQMKDDEKEQQVENNDEDDELGIRKIIPERKTRREKNRRSRRLEKESNIRKKQRAAKVKEDLSKVNEILDGIKEKEENQLFKLDQKLLEKKKDSEEIDKPIFDQIAGQSLRNEFHNQPFALSEELSHSWRNVKPAKNVPLLQERILSFERRGMLEPPSVVPRELKQMRKQKLLDDRKDKIKRKGKGSTSNISYWREKSRKK